MMESQQLPLPQVAPPSKQRVDKPSLKWFIKNNPPIFEGIADLFVAKEWINILEKILKFI